MKGILGFLARANLVELTEEERLKAVADGHAETPGSVPPPEEPVAQAPLPPPLNIEECEIADDRPLEEIFSAAGVPESPYPVEKMLRLLDGLRAMDAATRKAAVLAMDAADDNWQIADCVGDAERKIAAIEAYKQHLAAQVEGSEQQVSMQIAELKSALENTTAAIRRQISELEELLQREVAKEAQQTTSLEAGLRATREAAARETRRMAAEVERLSEITLQFGPG